MQKINIVESGRKFSEGNINELKRFLSKIPHSHLEALNQIERIPVLDNAYADSSPWGIGEDIRLSDSFYSLTPKEREFAFIHEMGHDYFDFRDEKNGKSMLKWRICKKEEVAHLFGVQWMELGEWELDSEIWGMVKSIFQTNMAHKNKYTYMVKYKNPNLYRGEWKCTDEGKILWKFQDLAFRYNQSSYSPKEEMADCYAFFALEREKFSKLSEENEMIKAKYNFMGKFFDGSKGKVILERI